jgi:hypothetical protein
MDIREYLGDIILIIILCVSMYSLLATLHVQPGILLPSLLIVLSVGGLFLIIHHKLRVIEQNITNRERMIRVSLEEISEKMARRYDSSVDQIGEIVAEITRRVYR